MIPSMFEKAVTPGTGAAFPQVRLRRLRRTPAMRALVRETHLHPSQFILPLFVRGGTGVRTPISSMPESRSAFTCRSNRLMPPI